MSYKVGYQKPVANRRGRGQLSTGLQFAQLDASVAEALNSWAEDVEFELSKYPAETETGQRVTRSVLSAKNLRYMRTYDIGAGKGEGAYERTGELARRWQHRIANSHGALAVEFTNYARDRSGRFYANLVQGAQQTWFHRDHGWRTIREILKEFGEELREDVQRSINRALGAD